MPTLYVFVVGAVGAAAPEIVRLYRARSRRFTIHSPNIAISCLFFALGGFIAVILPASTPWGAFYVGVSTPVLISRLAAGGAALEPAPAAPRSTTRGDELPVPERHTIRDYLALL
jgi:hypothetical protein